MEKVKGGFSLGTSVMIISSEIVGIEGFCEFLLSLGGKADTAKNLRGTVHQRGSTAWLGLLPRSDFESFYDDEDLLEWKEKLGRDPETIIEIRLDHTDEIVFLYLWIAFIFGRKWNSVLCDQYDNILDYSEVCKRYFEKLNK